MNQLEKIFSDAPARCEEVRLSCRVYFKAPVAYILTGWLYYQHGIWQRIEAHADQPSISQAELDKALLAAGWSMDARPTKRSATEFTYTFKRATGDFSYSLHSKTVGYTERRGTERAMQAIDAHISGAILQAPGSVGRAADWDLYA